MAETPQTVAARMRWPLPVATDRPEQCTCDLGYIGHDMFLCNQHRWIHHCTADTCDAIGRCSISGREHRDSPRWDNAQMHAKHAGKRPRQLSVENNEFCIMSRLEHAWRQLYGDVALPPAIVRLATTMMDQMNHSPCPPVASTMEEWNCVWQQVILLATDPCQKRIVLASGLRIPQITLDQPLELNRDTKPFDRHTPRTKMTKGKRVRDLTSAFQKHVERVYQTMKGDIERFNAHLQEAVL